MSPIKLPKVKQVWTVSDKLGGWDATQRKFFAGGVRPSRASCAVRSSAKEPWCC